MEQTMYTMVSGSALPHSIGAVACATTARAVSAVISDGGFAMPEDEWCDYADYSAGEDVSPDDTCGMYDDGEDE